LTIEDGGPNDADGVADGRIADPGGVTANLSSGSGAGSGSGGGGTFNLWVIVLLTIILFIQCMGRLNRYQRNHIT
ncbi:MAG: hypothetical protein AB2672_13050, partial [Candidatus Thiodiazotropha endolucinida]